jgi:hypothetical protein
MMRLAAVAAFVGGVALFVWITGLPRGDAMSWQRVGWVAAMLGAAAAMFGAWAALIADIALKRGWGPRFCQLSTVPFLLIGLVAFFSDAMSDETPMWAVCMATSSGVAGLLCRKIAYPGGRSRDDREPSIR